MLRRSWELHRRFTGKSFPTLRSYQQSLNVINLSLEKGEHMPITLENRRRSAVAGIGVAALAALVLAANSFAGTSASQSAPREGNAVGTERCLTAVPLGKGTQTVTAGAGLPVAGHGSGPCVNVTIHRGTATNADGTVTTTAAARAQ